MDKHLPSRHSGESRNPVRTSDIQYNQINEMVPGFCPEGKRAYGSNTPDVTLGHGVRRSDER